MDTLAYSRCMECDEEKFFDDGSRCALCLGLSSAPIHDEDGEDNAEDLVSIAFDLFAAA